MEQLEKDKRIHQKIKRFKTKHAQMRHIFQEVRGRHALELQDVVQMMDCSLLLHSLILWFFAG